MTIGLVCLGFTLWPSARKIINYIPAWVFWGVAIILGINLLRTLLGALFGRSAADNFTDNLLSSIFRPVIALIEGLIRSLSG